MVCYLHRKSWTRNAFTSYMAESARLKSTWNKSHPLPPIADHSIHSQSVAFQRLIRQQLPKGHRTKTQHQSNLEDTSHASSKDFSKMKTLSFGNRSKTCGVTFVPVTNGYKYMTMHSLMLRLRHSKGGRLALQQYASTSLRRQVL